MSTGTSQNERMPIALDPEYFNVDERSIQDLYREARELAKNLAFYDTSPEEASGTWSPFFEDVIVSDDLFDPDGEVGDWPPHLGLFLAFLKLFGYPQRQLNELTTSHLHFFYNKVLGQEKKEAKPDKVFVFFGLARNESQFLLPENSVLSAGKSAQGQELLYTTDRQAFLSHAMISDFKAIRNKKNSIHSIEMFPVANSRDGLGTPLEESEGWQPFGGQGVSGRPATIGFAVDSPVLLLKEGVRTIHLSFSVSGERVVDLEKLSADEFEVRLTGPEGWIRKEMEATGYEDGKLTFSVRLDESDPPVVGFDENMHEYELNASEWAILSVGLKEGLTYDRYELLQSIKVKGISIKTDVRKVRSLLVRNDFGELETDKAFNPFGYTPVKGATLFLGLEETFGKRVTRLSFHINWKGLPENLKTYYEGYLGPTNSLVSSDEDFKVKAAIRRQGEWIELKNRKDESEEVPLFSDSLEFEPEIDSVKPVSYEKAGKSEDGMIRLTLSSPDHAFGHKLYPSVYAKAIMSQMKEKPAPIPNEPYTPAIDSIEMNYTAEGEVDRFFHIKPFGVEQVSAENKPLISGEFHHAGSLYMGIKNLQPPQQLSIFFDLEQEVQGEKPLPGISYLSQNGWSRLPQNQILSDTTLGLKQSGIILLNLPTDINAGNPAMPIGLHWIRFTVDDHPGNFDRILSVRTNAVSCTLKKELAVEGTEINALPPDTIKNFSKKRAEIKKIEQPYPSFGGRPAEQENGYFTRVSERLRHKNRGISAWDYERIILEKFPEIYKVSCLPHRNTRGLTVPGNVHIIVIPFLKQFSRSNVLKPIVPDSTLEKIKIYVERLTSSNVNIQVTNPFFEEIKIIASVSFNMQVDAGYYVKKLQQGLQQYFSPWAFSDETEIQLGSKLYRSSIIEFIESRQYINFIASIRLMKNGRLIEDEEISPDMQTLIVSSDFHEINVVEPDAVICQTNQGIEQMIVDINFEVQ